MRAFVLAALLVISGTVGASAGLVAKIDISAQTMTVSRDGDVLYSWAVSTARKGLSYTARQLPADPSAQDVVLEEIR